MSSGGSSDAGIAPFIIVAQPPDTTHAVNNATAIQRPCRLKVCTSMADRYSDYFRRDRESTRAAVIIFSVLGGV